MKILAIIPARSGSKGITDKNIQLLGGHPLIEYSIEAARAAAIDRIIVSTDSATIATIATSLGAEAPFLRPPELAQDDTPGIDPILHAVEWLRDHEHYQPQLVCCLQPTSPLRTAADINAALTVAEEKRADAVVSVTATHEHPAWMKCVDADGRVSDFLPAATPVTRRQDLPRVFALNGAIYLGRTDVLVRRRTWYTDRTYAYVMPRERSIDIDTSWDLELAEWALSRR